MKTFQSIIANNRAGRKQGIYAICTANPLVLEAAFQQGRRDGTPVLIEATANQVNQFGGYTGMRPADFPPFIENIAKKVGFPMQDIILGGDHLGPVVWSDQPAEQAMSKAQELIGAYVKAGFEKIHLDTSMSCADDPIALSDEVVAARAALLCEVAERASHEAFGQSNLVYVVGTEVPPPGGASEAIEGLEVTPTKAVLKTVDAHKSAFLQLGLESAWSRVVGLVVQPGVEFDHTAVHDYVPEQAKRLSALIGDIPNLVYEAHSTDYQPAQAYHALVRDHFGILKVGPQLTYALREALFSLSHIEDELVEKRRRANLRDVCERVMLDEPKNWQKYYPSEEPKSRVYRRFSYSDRIRYYWNHPQVEGAIAKLFENLTKQDIPLPLLSQYMPLQYAAIRGGELNSRRPRELIRHHIMLVTDCYAKACWKNTECE